MQTKLYDDYVARATACRTFDATEEEVHQASTEWAGCNGWTPAAGDDGLPGFEVRTLFGWQAPQLTVLTYPDGDRTDAQFRVSASPVRTGLQEDVERVAEAFAEGVRKELALEKGQLMPGARSELLRFKKRRRTTHRLIKKSELPLWIALAPLMVLVWFTTKDPGYTMAIGMYVLTFLIVGQILRLRATGMRLKLQLWVLSIGWFSLVVIWTGLMIATAAGHGPQWVMD